MTNREFLTAVSTNAITEDVIAHEVAQIEKLDAANEKRKNKTSPKDMEKAAENAKFDEIVIGVLTNEPQIEADIAGALGVTGPKARAALKRLVETNVVVKSEVKVPKKGVVKAYALAPTENVVEG
jgi:transcription termination factor NusB